jgi:hypothetical protein
MARKLIVEIVGDTSSLEKAFRKSGADTRTFAEKSSSMGKTLAKTGLFAGAAIGVGALTAAIHTGISEFTDSQKVAAQTAAVLKSTGGAAGVTAKQVDDLASSMLNYTGIDDETIKSGENLLLTFTNIRNEAGKNNDIFTQATKVTTDLSVALGEDMKSAAIQVGKALNDPVRGITALRRVGVSFTKAQQDQIKVLVKTGHTMQAQKVILAELHKEFGGSARAAGDTLAGKLNILRETFKNLAGRIVELVIPAFTRLVDRANKWLTNARNQQKIINAAKAAFNALTTGIHIITAAFQTLSKIVGGNTNAIYALVAAYAAWKILSIAGNIATLAGKFGLLATSTKTAEGATSGLSASFIGKAGLVVGAGAAAFALTTLILKVTGLDQKLRGAGSAAYDLAAKLGLAQGAPAAALSQGAFSALRRQAAGLERGGLTPEQAAARLQRMHPGYQAHDIAVAAAGIHISGGIHLHGVQNPRELQDAITKAARGRPVRRRGDP